VLATGRCRPPLPARRAADRLVAWRACERYVRDESGRCDREVLPCAADGQPAADPRGGGELPRIGLGDAAAILLVIEQRAPDTFERAALRCWRGCVRSRAGSASRMRRWRRRRRSRSCRRWGRARRWRRCANDSASARRRRCSRVAEDEASRSATGRCRDSTRLGGTSRYRTVRALRRRATACAFRAARCGWRRAPFHRVSGVSKSPCRADGLLFGGERENRRRTSTTSCCSGATARPSAPVSTPSSPRRARPWAASNGRSMGERLPMRPSSPLIQRPNPGSKGRD
jgi:hypothetical protein